MGYVIQETGLFPHFNVERNVGLVLEARAAPGRIACAAAHELLEAVGLNPDHLCEALSAPAFRRPAPACRPGPRALAAEPDFLLMDEPFGALDPLTRAEMQDMLREPAKSPEEDSRCWSRTIWTRPSILLIASYLLSEGKLIANLGPKNSSHRAGQRYSPTSAPFIAAIEMPSKKTQPRGIQPPNIQPQKMPPQATEPRRSTHERRLPSAIRRRNCHTDRRTPLAHRSGHVVCHLQSPCLPASGLPARRDGPSR